MSLFRDRELPKGKDALPKYGYTRIWNPFTADPQHPLASDVMIVKSGDKKDDTVNGRTAVHRVAVLDYKLNQDPDPNDPTPHAIVSVDGRRGVRVVGPVAVMLPNGDGIMAKFEDHDPQTP